jgi:hypothetical protein
MDRIPDNVPMCAMGVDIAQGGEDNTVIAMRYDGWYAKLVKKPGKDTPLGKDVAGLVVSHRRDQAKVVLDMGGGYGGATYECLKDNIGQIDIVKHKGSEASQRRTKQGGLKFFNKRAEVYYRFREALDPDQAGGSHIMLPPDPVLFSDLCAIRLQSDESHVIKLEPKDHLVKRLGRSPDCSDAVVMAWHSGVKAENKRSGEQWRQHRTPQVVMSKRYN